MHILKKVYDTIEEVEAQRWPSGNIKFIIYKLYIYFRATQGHLPALIYVYNMGKIDGIKEKERQNNWNNFATFTNVKHFFNDPATNNNATYQDFSKWFEERTGYHYE